MSILEIERVTKTFAGIRAVDDESFGFEEGKISALIGPNGAGKTTVFNLISGFLRPDQGIICYRDVNLVGLPPWDIANLGVGRLFQDVSLFNRMTLRDNVMVAFKSQLGEKALLSVFARWKVRKEERALILRAMDLLAFVGLASKADDLAENLSYGQQKLLSIARLLATQADLFLIDEPTAGINPGMVEKILGIIQQLAKEGKTILIIEHNMNVVLELAHWVYFMQGGKIVSFGLPRDVLENPEVRSAYIGL